MVVREYHGITERAEQILAVGNPEIRGNLAFHRIVVSTCHPRGYCTDEAEAARRRFPPIPAEFGGDCPSAKTPISRGYTRSAASPTDETPSPEPRF